MPEPRPNLQELINIARAAGDILHQGYGGSHHVHHKGAADIVTEFDHRSEALLVEHIQRHYPDHTIVTEESGLINGGGTHCWYLDPLDGTTNFAHGFPMFCVSIGYAVDNQMQLGAVYDPLRDECFCAQKDEGAWLNGTRLHVSSTANLVDSLLVTGFAYEIEGGNPDATDSSYFANIEYFSRFTRCTQGVRRTGSAALDMCYVASRRVDGFWELRLEAWDVAAGSLIITESGGAVTDLQGGPNFMKPPYPVVAANPDLHAHMLEVLNAL